MTTKVNEAQPPLATDRVTKDIQLSVAREHFRKSVGFQFGFVRYSGLEESRAIDHICQAAERLLTAAAASPITQPTASASAQTTTVPDESSLQHQTGSWWCCDADYPNHSASCSNASESSSPPPDAGVVVNKTEATLAEIREPKKRQLAHSARQMFETRWAKYNDPHNEEWDFDYDMQHANKWERHAWSAYLDLVDVEKERNALLGIIDSLQAEKTALQESWLKAIDAVGTQECRAITAESKLNDAASNMKTLIVERVRGLAAEYESVNQEHGVFRNSAELLYSLATELEAIEPNDLSGR